MVDVIPTALPGVLEIVTPRFGDDRGIFSETWNAAAFAEAGIDTAFVQDNFSRSAKGVLRGLHYQVEPIAQAKLVRVGRGAIFDVAVDIRRSSPTFGRWTGIELSAARWNQLFVPAGFAHGFIAVEDDTEVQYKVSAPYSAAHDRAIAADDPAIGIDWPLAPSEWSRSAKDVAAPLLAQAEIFA
ncbi:dTDP-4-dehydrorhamnose 3,5-epimerase [Sphingomonas rosea]|uniref:dTDP-4-dehydrorhamnose 3,5-epimerase n=1 Tax=Sphingomonas rosea TaxID=335605 RepID=A0ABP7UAV1_9SPHN